MRRWGIVLLVTLALAGCTTRVGEEPTRSATPPPTPSAPVSPGPSLGAVDLRLPLLLSPVVPAGGTAPSVLPDPDGNRLRLAEPFLTITRLDDAALQFQNYDGTWAVVLELTEPDAATFADWTTGHTGEQVAIVANGRVIAAPTIQSAITNGFVVISARYTERAARDLLAQLAGR